MCSLAHPHVPSFPRRHPLFQMTYSDHSLAILITGHVVPNGMLSTKDSEPKQEVAFSHSHPNKQCLFVFSLELNLLRTFISSRTVKLVRWDKCNWLTHTWSTSQLVLLESSQPISAMIIICPDLIYHFEPCTRQVACYSSNLWPLWEFFATPELKPLEIACWERGLLLSWPTLPTQGAQRQEELTGGSDVWHWVSSSKNTAGTY